MAANSKSGAIPPLMFKSMRKTVVLILISSLFGCAAPTPPLTEKQWKSMSTRHYEHATHDEIFEAAKKAFTQSDHDFKFSYYNNEMIARRQWNIFLLITATFGTDTWTIRAVNDDQGGVDVELKGFRSLSGRTMSYFGVDQSPQYGNVIDNHYIYDFFYSRLDNKLGLTDHWPTCYEFEKDPKHQNNGHTGYFCGVTSDEPTTHHQAKVAH